MNDTIFRPLKEADKEIIAGLIKSLYGDDPHGKTMTDIKIMHTFQALSEHPDYGSVMVFERKLEIVGYAILINFWSNEYGGLILTVDELLVVPHLRNLGIGTAFINYLIRNNFRNFMALKLEVLPYNTRALKLYENLGFKQADRHHLVFER